MTIKTTVTQSALRQTQHNTWQGNLSSARLIAHKPITVCRWRSNGQWKRLHLILPAEPIATGAEPIATEELHIVETDRFRLFQLSCASIWTKSSKLTNVFKTWTILGLQSTMLRTLPGTFGQSSIAFAKLY